MSKLTDQLELLKEQVLDETVRPIFQVERMAGVVRVVHREEVPAEMEWHTVEGPRRLRRVLQLHDISVVKFFIGELLDYERESHHNGSIQIEGTRLTLEVYTHDVNDITASDRSYAVAVDTIYADALDLFNRQNMLATGGPCGTW